MMQFKQKGFTLLELLVVITLLAVLSVGALVAYEGIGDNAQVTAAANNTAGADRAIRNYRAVTQNYPDQWDNLVVNGGASAGTAPAFLADATRASFASMAFPTLTTGAAITAAFANVGITELQSRTVATTTVGVEPNLQHNEGAVLASATPGDVGEELFSTQSHFAILPAWNGDTDAACTISNGTFPAATLNATAIDIQAAYRQNQINDNLEDDQCNLVVALGFGHDAAHSTNASSVAISTAPTYVSRNINPNTQYARYIALFHAAQDADEDGLIADTEIFGRARLLAVLDTEGRAIDQLLAAQNPAN